MRKILMFFALLIISTSFSQVQDVRPPISDVLIKNMEISPSLSNGMINPTVNIYEVKYRDISIPIGISYYGRGVKVRDVASEVGLGWGVSVPYKISREIRGSRDEGALGYLNNNIYENFFSSIDKRRQVASDNANHDLDLYPDKFYFSLPGKSGSFFFNWRDKTVFLQQFDDLKITYKYKDSEIDEFQIVDDKGYIYTYGREYKKMAASENYIYDWLKNNFQSTGVSDYNCESWYLNSVVVDGVAAIIFDYQPCLIEHYNKDYDAISSKFAMTVGGEEGSIKTFVSKTMTNDKLLSSIRFPSGLVSLSYSNKREDLVSGMRLEEIIVSNSSSIKKFKFNYSYRQSENLRSTPGFLLALDPSAINRLFLENVEEYDLGSTLYRTTSFLYNKPNLPDRFSNSVDMWGYYNNADNGPFMDINGLDGSKDRSVSSVYSSAGILQAIKYPTGMETNFVYENNEGRYAINDANVIKIGDNNTEIFYNESIYCTATKSNCSIIDDYRTEFEKEFVLPNDISVSGPIKVDFQYNKLASVDGNIGCEYYTAQILDENNNPIILFPNRGLSDVLLKDDKQILGDIFRTGKKYKFKVNAWNCPFENDNRNFILTLAFPQGLSTGSGATSSNNNEVFVYGEGKRIKSVKYSEGGKDLRAVEYKYTNEDGSKKSGVIIGYPYYFTILGERDGVKIFDPYGVRPGSSFFSYNLNSIIYNSVVETFTDGQSNAKGKTVYRFSDHLNGGGKYYIWPYHYPIDNEWLRGLPEMVSTYSFKNGAYVKVKDVINKFEIGGSEFYHLVTDLGNFMVADQDLLFSDHNRFALPLVRFYYDIKGAVNPASTPPPSVYLINPTLSLNRGENLYYKTFFLTGGSLRKVRTEEIDYLDKEIKVSTDYEYKLRSQQMASQKVNYPDSNVVATSFQYATDSGNQYLTDRNIIGIPLRTTVTKIENGISKVISDTEVLYPTSQSEADQKTGGLPLPYASVLHDLQSGATHTELTYDRYDPLNGNLLQYTSKSGIPTALIWGYGGTQPIAKVEGATYGQVEALAAEIIDLSNRDTDEGSEEAFLGALDRFRSNSQLSPFQITTYTHDPLIGVTSITPPSGIREVYRYDDAGRLKSVTDVNGKVIKEHKYNYKQQ